MKQLFEMVEDLEKLAETVGVEDDANVVPPNPDANNPYEYTALLQLCAMLDDSMADLEHYVATHGPGPDVRLKKLKLALANVKKINNID